MVVLQTTIDTLQGQLEVKDHQIEQQAQIITRLTDTLTVTQQTVAAPKYFRPGRCSNSFFPARPELIGRGGSKVGLVGCLEIDFRVEGDQNG